MRHFVAEARFLGFEAVTWGLFELPSTGDYRVPSQLDRNSIPSRVGVLSVKHNTRYLRIDHDSQ